LKSGAKSGILRQMRLVLTMIPNVRPLCLRLVSFALLAAMLSAADARTLIAGQNNEPLTAIQREIARQRQRLNSTDIEERRDALMRLANLKRSDASRVAAAGLSDVAPIVRVTAMQAIQSLPPAEVNTLLVPSLKDKLEFVRREAAYALGMTHSRAATAPLVDLLLTDKEAGVRGAAAVALGEIRDDSAVQPLVQVLAGQPEKKKKAKTEKNQFVLRAAARSLGQIGSRAAVEVLITTLANDANDSDVRREAATALGLIGDASAVPALQAAFASSDPYLSEAARESLRLLKLARK
jgi:HEAT repeat protein